MIKPIHKHYDTHRRTTILYFDHEPDRPIEFYMRGGICWPIRYENPTGQIDNSGYVLMAGQDVKTGRVMIFEETQWVTIDNILGDNHVIRYPGLSHWFNKVWEGYFAQSFYWQQEDELARRFRLQILRSKMIHPKPRFVEVPYSDTSDMISCIWTMLKANKLNRASGTVLQQQLEMVKEGDKQVLPAVHALGCCLLGFERFPWREPKEPEIREILVA